MAFFIIKLKPTNTLIPPVLLSAYRVMFRAHVVRHQATMVIFMPTVRNTKLKDLVAKLSTHYSPQTPIALVACAGYQEKERVIRGTLENIVNKLGDQSLPFEHLIYVGDFLEQRIKKDR